MASSTSSTGGSAVSQKTASTPITPSLVRIGKVIALRSSALAAAAALAPQPSEPIGDAIEPRPVLSTRLIDAGPAPTPRALPAATKAATARDPSEDEQCSS